jgi:hypothetical protein
MARQSRATAIGEQPKAIIQSCGNLLDGQHSDARRRQFDRQRDAIQPMTHLRDGWGVIVCYREIERSRHCALNKQLHGLILS